MTPTDFTREADQFRRRLRYTQAELDHLRHLIIGDWRAERDARDQEQRAARNRETFGR